MYNGPNIVTDGLVLALDAANDKSYAGSGNTWNDLSGGENDVVLINSPTFNNDSIIMDSTDDYIQATNTSVFDNSAFTVELSFNLLQNLDDSNFVGFFSNLKGSNSGWQLFWNSRGLYFYLYVTNRTVVETNSNEIDQDTTIHLVARYNNSKSNEAAIFVNNTKYSGNDSGRYTSPELPPRLFGRRGDSNINYGIDCNVYFVRYYKRALSDQEVLQNYNATKSRFGL